MDEMVGGWKKIHNEEFHTLYPMSDIIRMIKSWSMRSAGHTVRMEKRTT
jgi:hypothetical protein